MGDANLNATVEVTDDTTAAVVMGVGDCGGVSVSCARLVPNRQLLGVAGSPTHQ